MNIRLLLYLSILATISFSSCGETYDDSSIHDRIQELEARASSLESLESTLNSNVVSLEQLVKSLNNKKLISKIEDTEKGFRIYFTDNTKIEIVQGRNGHNGINGIDGYSPVIGVLQDEGVYYWTITTAEGTTFLTDSKGNKLPVIAVGKDGAAGKDGKDGKTPLFKVDADGFWMVSYNDGDSYEYVYNTEYKLVNALGAEASSSSISYDDHGTFYTIYLQNGGELKLAKHQELGISFSQTELVQFGSDKRCVIDFWAIGMDADTKIDILAAGNITATLNYSGGTSGSISVYEKGPITSSTKLFVYLCKDNRTITNVITFKSTDNRIDSVIPEDVREKIDDYIDIYDGINPPFIEGCYIMDPLVTVYCDDAGVGGPEAGTRVVPMKMRFYDQNMTENIISIEEVEEYGGEISSSSGIGAFISGSGNDFSIYFKLEGYTYGIFTKTAVLISGHYTTDGIKDCKYAFIMLEKGYDPSDVLMKEGVYRVFEDEDHLSVPIVWTRANSEFQTIMWNNLPHRYSSYHKD